MATTVDESTRGDSVARRPGRGARGPLSGAAGLLVLVLCLLGALEARAQSTTTPTSSLTPISSPNNVISMVPNAQGIERGRPYYSISRPWWISFDDCFANDTWTFNLNVRDNSNPLEIWAGTENCATNRSREDRGQCWIVARVSQLDDTVAVPVPVRNVVARRLNTTEPPESVGVDVCDDSDDPSGEAVTFYFLIEEGGQADEYFSWDASDNGGTGFDTLGPEPPDNISVGIGESQLSINIDGVDEETDRDRFEAYCVPAGTTFQDIGQADPDEPGIVDAGGSFATPDAGGTGGSGGTLGDAGSLDGGSLDGGLDASVGGSANAGSAGNGGGGASGAGGSSGSGADAGGFAPAACFTEILREGRRPPPGFSCGTVSETSRTLNTSQLTNGISYAVAIAGQDNIGNAGVASNIACGTPVPLDDFFELYSRRGGPGGGGFCSVTPGRHTTGSSAAVLVGLLLAGLTLRRTRRGS